MGFIRSVRCNHFTKYIHISIPLKTETQTADNVETGGRHFCIFDELYSGTNPDEASKSAYGFLRYLAKRENVRFMLTTHYISVCKRLEEEECERIRYLQMEVQEEGDDYLYTHCLGEGICEIQGGVQVLRKMNYPEELLGYIM